MEPGPTESKTEVWGFRDKNGSLSGVYSRAIVKANQKVGIKAGMSMEQSFLLLGVRSDDMMRLEGSALRGDATLILSRFPCRSDIIVVTALPHGLLGCFMPLNDVNMKIEYFLNQKCLCRTWTSSMHKFLGVFDGALAANVPKHRN